MKMLWVSEPSWDSLGWDFTLRVLRHPLESKEVVATAGLGSHLSPLPAASKGSGQGTIYLWSWSQTWAGRGSQSVLPVVILARLQWSSTNLAYFSLSTCPGEPAYPTGGHPLFPSQPGPILGPHLSWQTKTSCCVGMRKAECGSMMLNTC